MHRFVPAVAAAMLLVTTSPASAADKTHQQMMAEIRMLQEQQQQLEQMLGGLADTLKTVTARMDDQTNANRKAFADQKLLIDSIAEGVRILREKVGRHQRPALVDDAGARIGTPDDRVDAGARDADLRSRRRPATLRLLPSLAPRRPRRRTSRRRKRTTRPSTTTPAASTTSRSRASTSI